MCQIVLALQLHCENPDQTLVIHNFFANFILLRRSFNCELKDAGIHPLLLAPQVRQRTMDEVG